MAKFEVNEELVRKLADLLQETGLSEIEYEVNNHRIRVAKSAGVTVAAAPAPMAAPCAPLKPATPGGPEAVPAGAVTAPRTRRAALREGRRPGERGPGAADHRGHEGDEPDPRRAPARSRIMIETASRWSTASRCW
jgi:hypothetical protein